MPRPWASHQSSLSQSSASVPLKVQLLFLRDPPTPRQCIYTEFPTHHTCRKLGTRPPILLPPPTSAAPPSLGMAFIAVSWELGAVFPTSPTLNSQGRRVRHGDEAKYTETNIGYLPERSPRYGAVVQHGLDGVSGACMSTRGER